MLKKFYNMKLPVIYDIEYLMNKELSDDDLHNLFDTKSLIYSLVIGEFREIKSNLKNEDIVNIIKKDNWQYNYFWSERQLNRYEQKLFKVFKNIYVYDDSYALKRAQNFIILYGLTNSKMKKRKKQILDE